MRLTIIPDDGFVSIDGIGFSGIDLSFMEKKIHAVQWYGSRGEIEIRELEFNKIIQNKVIDSIDEFQNVINKWHEEKQKFDNAFVDSNNLIAE